MSISDKFSALIERIAPSPTEVSDYSTHLRTINSAVETALSIYETERIGSFTRGTAVRGVSDLDLMAVLSSNERKWGRGTTTSTTTVDRVKYALAARFASASIRNSGNAVASWDTRVRVTRKPTCLAISSW